MVYLGNQDCEYVYKKAVFEFCKCVFMVDQFNHNSYESFCLAVVQKSFHKMVPLHTCVDHFRKHYSVF